MVKILFSVIVAAVAVEDDVTALLQVSAGVHHQVSKGQLILAAVSKDSSKDTICVKAAAGDVAPITGSFTAKMSQQAVEVAVGSVAQEVGSFCVPTQDVLLLQRTLGLATAQDFEAALGRKGETAATTPTTEYVRYTSDTSEGWDFEEDAPTGLAAVEHCPAASLLQTMDATVSKKKETTIAAPEPKALTNGQERVCSCRTSLEALSDGIGKFMGTEAGKKLIEEGTPLLLQSLDGALSKKKGDESTTTTTTAKATAPERTLEQKQMLAFNFVTCHAVKESNNTISWASVAKGLNVKVGDFGGADLTHCDRGWVVKGACSEILKEPDMLDGMDEAAIAAVEAAAKTFFTAE